MASRLPELPTSRRVRHAGAEARAHPSFAGLERFALYIYIYYKLAGVKSLMLHILARKFEQVLQETNKILASLQVPWSESQLGTRWVECVGN